MLCGVCCGDGGCVVVVYLSCGVVVRLVCWYCGGGVVCFVCCGFC